MDFLKDCRRFSFRLGEKNIDALPCRREITEESDTVTTVYRFENGLKVTNLARRYPAFDAYEWVNIFENTAQKPGEIISDILDCDCTLPFPHEEDSQWQAYLPDAATATKIYAPEGSDCDATEFFCDVDRQEGYTAVYHIAPGETRRYACEGGRSSHGRAPFFHVFREQEGFLLAIGWSGQWNCIINRANDTLTLCSGIEGARFRLLPGEKLRTSSVVLMPYHDGFSAATNRWRRLVRAHFSLIGQPGRDSAAPLCAGIWGGMKTASALSRIRAIQENGLPFEYIWMDAGWYGADTAPTPDEFTGDWYSRTGDWRPSPMIHPAGLRPVADAAHRAGMKFLLWFEPERVLHHTPVASAHPDWFLTNGEPGEQSRLLDLGNPAAWDYCFRTLSGLIEEIGIDCLRQDFNFPPLSFWRKNDLPDRQGITEIRHITGLYRLWDALLKKFPALLIDNCASGGRRIDIETLRRSVPLWRSDFQCPANFNAEAIQCHTLSFNRFLPYSGTASGRIYDEYRIRSCYAAAMTANYSFSEREPYCDTPEKIAFLQKYTAEFLRVRPYFSADFYPLTQMSTRTDIWCASQFNRPEEGDGMVEVFVRENAPYETARFRLFGLEEAADYVFTDLDGGSFTASGKALAAEGLCLTLTEKRKAKIYLYRKKT